MTLLSALLATLAPVSYEPTESYTVMDVEGFTVRVSKYAREAPTELDPALALLRTKLTEINRIVPKEAQTTLKKIEFWVEREAPKHPCMCYHGDVGWLKANGFNPDKEDAVELANLKNFVTWATDQPFMVLHELAHGYHDLSFGFDGMLVLDAYKAAMDQKLYDAVDRVRSTKPERAYAATNQMEYFAELTEAYFGYNDFFPFVRSELARHDPAGLEMIKKAWHVTK